MEAKSVSTQTIVPTAQIPTRDFPSAPLVAWLAERIVRFRWPNEWSIDPVLARAVDEAFESLAREARN